MPIYDVDFPGTVYIRARLLPHGEWSTWAELLLEDEARATVLPMPALTDPLLCSMALAYTYGIRYGREC